MSKKAYIYPITNRNNKGVINPYLFNFIESFNGKIEFVNKDKPSNIGIVNLIPLLFGKLDFVFLNWLEDLPDKKLGKLQCLLFVYIIVPVLKIKGTKIVWTYHNKLSHYKTNIKIKKWLQKKLAGISDIILTHAKDGIKSIEEINAKAATRCVFMHHPLNNVQVNKQSAPNYDYDLLIWGTVLPYKGILEFVQEFKGNQCFSGMKLMVAGRIPDTEYAAQIEKLKDDNIIINNKFLETKELNTLINKSKATLFTYKDNSVLSSGALMDSIITGARIIGPKAGAFKDLDDEKLIQTYNSFNEIPDLLNKEMPENLMLKLNKFIEENRWESFGDRLYNHLIKTNK